MQVFSDVMEGLINLFIELSQYFIKIITIPGTNHLNFFGYVFLILLIFSIVDGIFNNLFGGENDEEE